MVLSGCFDVGVANGLCEPSGMVLALVLALLSDVVLLELLLVVLVFGFEADFWCAGGVCGWWCA